MNRSELSRADAGGGIAVYAFTAGGAALGARLAEQFAGRGRAVLYLSAGAAERASRYEERPDAPDAPGAPGETGRSGGLGEPGGFTAIVFSGLRELLQTTFQDYAAHIFIGAAGIAVRGIAPFLRSKAEDPAVLVLDQRARHVVSLLSGHLGGANALCLEVAGMTGANPVISTATDLEALPAIDLLAQAAGLRIANLGAVKAVSAALLDNRPVWLDDPEAWFPDCPPGFCPLHPPAPMTRHSALPPSLHVIPLQPGPHNCPSLQELPVPNAPRVPRVPPVPLVRVSHCLLPTAPDILLLHPKSLWVGVGCKRGIPAQSLRNALERLFAEACLSMHSLAGFASIERKSDESGLLALARDFALPLRFFSAAELAAVPTPNISPKAQELFNTPSVAEAAALLAARAAAESFSKPGENRLARAELLLPKRVFTGITLAAAKYGFIK